MRFWLLPLCLVLLSPGLMADSPGRVSVTVTERSDQALAEAREQALEQLLMQMTGQQTVARLNGVPALLADPQRWVVREHFQAGDQWVLEFDVRALRERLAREGAPLWGASVPSVLLWFVDQGPGRGSLLTASHPWIDEIQALAKQRGFAFQLPQWDDQDQQRLALGDIRGRFDEPLLAASGRYQADLLVPVVLYHGAPPRLNGRLLQGKEQLAQQRLTGDSIDALLQQWVDELAQALVAEFGSAGGTLPEPRRESRLSASGTLFEVSRVQGLAGWRFTEQFLQGISGMSQVRLAKVSEYSVIFALEYDHSEAQLRRQLSLFTAISECPGGEGAQSLHYCWQL